MKNEATLEAGRKAIEAAGFRFDELRSFAPADGRPGYAFSVESDRACYGHPMMEVRIDPAPEAAPEPVVVETVERADWSETIGAEIVERAAHGHAGLVWVRTVDPISLEVHRDGAASVTFRGTGATGWYPRGNWRRPAAPAAAPGRSLARQADDARLEREERAGDLWTASEVLGDDFPSVPGGCGAPGAWS